MLCGEPGQGQRLDWRSSLSSVPWRAMSSARSALRAFSRVIWSCRAKEAGRNSSRVLRANAWTYDHHLSGGVQA